MNEGVKLGFQFLALIVAGAVGYMFASSSISELSKSSINAAVEMGKAIGRVDNLKETTSNLEAETTTLSQRNKTLQVQLKSLEALVSNFQSSDPVRFAEIVRVFKENPDAQRLAERVNSIQSKVEKIEQSIETLDNAHVTWAFISFDTSPPRISRQSSLKWLSNVVSGNTGIVTLTFVQNFFSQSPVCVPVGDPEGRLDIIMESMLLPSRSQ